MRNRYTEFERSTVIGKTSIDKRAAEAARKWNHAIDTDLVQRRKEWIFIPPSNVTLTLHADAGEIPSGLILSVPHQVGCLLLRRRMGRIIERDVAIDAQIEGGVEDAIEAMGL